jgi:hypothetical protein
MYLVERERTINLRVKLTASGSIDSLTGLPLVDGRYRSSAGAWTQTLADSDALIG